MYSKELKTAMAAAKKAGSLVMKYYGKVEKIYKKDKSVVTAADHASEALIKKMIHKRFPSHSFIGEESGHDDRGSDLCWAVDPLDGTTNFTVQNPFFNVSIALAYKGKPVVGVVYYPIAKELFSAEIGKGAYMDGKRISVSDVKDMQKAFLQFCTGHKKKNIMQMMKVYRELKLSNHHIRQLGAGALELCYVACGRTEAFFMPGANSWDVAAGALIVSEAGGKVTDFSGKAYRLNSTDIIASNGKFHPKLIKMFK